MDKLQLGWVYQDKRGIDVLIIRELPVNKEKESEDVPSGLSPLYLSTHSPSLNSTNPMVGITLGNEISLQQYTLTGVYSTSTDEYWYKDLLVETGKPWVPVAATTDETPAV